MAPHPDVPGTLWWHRHSFACCLLNLLLVLERLEFISTSGLALLFYCNCFPLLPHSIPLRNESFSIVLHTGTSFHFSNYCMWCSWSRYINACTNHRSVENFKVGKDLWGHPVQPSAHHHMPNKQCHIYMRPYAHVCRHSMASINIQTSAHLEIKVQSVFPGRNNIYFGQKIRFNWSYTYIYIF